VRNRIISGLSCGVIVVEAPEKSGALITAHAGADQGREVMVVPGSIYSPASVGCHRLIGDGAKIVTSVEDVLRVLGFTAGAAGRPAYRQDCLPVEVTGAEASVFAVLKHGPARFEGIVDECSLDAVDVGVALGMLEIRGLARRTAEGWFESAFGG
jgi:DNA processing protein